MERLVRRRTISASLTRQPHPAAAAVVFAVIFASNSARELAGTQQANDAKVAGTSGTRGRSWVRCAPSGELCSCLCSAPPCWLEPGQMELLAGEIRLSSPTQQPHMRAAVVVFV